MPRIDHQLVITQFEDGSHDISFEVNNKDTFPSFTSYIIGLNFMEHWVDKMSNELVSLLHKNQTCECGDPTCGLEEVDEPVVAPSEVFREESESSDEDIA